MDTKDIMASSENQTERPLNTTEKPTSANNVINVDEPQKQGASAITSPNNIANTTAKKSQLKSQQNDSQISQIIQQEKQKTVGDQIKAVLEAILENNVTGTFIGVITIYSLFGDDVRALSTDKNGDPYFWAINILCLIVFSIEIILASIVKKDYWLGFFFFLDVLSTLSILLDIGWFTQLVFGGGSSGSAANAAQLARAGRASRVGTKAGRIVRIVRLIRLVQLYKQAQQALALEAERMKNGDNNDENDDMINNTTNINQNNPINGKDLMIGGDQKIDPSPKNFGEQRKSGENPNQDRVIMTPNNGITDTPNQKQRSIMGPLPPIEKKQGPLQDEEQKNPLHVQSDEATQENKQGAQKEAALKNAREIIQINQDAEKQKEEEKNENGKDDKDMIIQETQVGAQLSNLTTQRVITLVMSIMISIPIFSVDTYFESIMSYDKGVNDVLRSYLNRKNNNDFISEFQDYVKYHRGNDDIEMRNPVIYIEFTEKTSVIDQLQAINANTYPNKLSSSSILRGDGIEDHNNLRDDEQQIIVFNIGDTQYGAIYVDQREDYYLNAILSIIRTIFVSIVLASGAMVFSNDVELLVVTPIENMLKQVSQIAENPLLAAQIEEQNAIIMENLLQAGDTAAIAQKQEEQKMETAILEKLIIKIGALLALGFGEAGSEIIAENMQKGGEVDPMIAGKKIMAIFGFCDIINFSDATEVLQTAVMVFVNEIAEIVHGTVDNFSGQSNKNIGEAFLLVWRYEKDDYTADDQGVLTLTRSDKVRRYSDMAVLAFIKVMAEINVAQQIAKYMENPGLNERIPNYRVRMGFGLHVGWGIEGAIGSYFKIDASYLSPNVNMASRLEAASRQFGVPLLLSGNLYQNLTPKLQKQLRKIDIVTVKGSIQPMHLWTCDVSFDNLRKRLNLAERQDQFDVSGCTRAEKQQKRVLQRMKRTSLQENVMSGKAPVADFFDQDREILYMREIFKKNFFSTWEEGFDAYIKGDWPAAQAVFQTTISMIPGYRDGPSNTLLQVIKSNGGKAPSTWKNYRVLTDK